MPEKPLIFYRLGTAGEKNLFLNNQDRYDGIIIDAHLASYYENFTESFLRKLDKPYFLDPKTYVYALDPDLIKKEGTEGKKKLKVSHVKLMGKYKSIIKEYFGRRKLYPKDFKVNDDWNEEAITDLTKNVLEFQIEFLRKSEEPVEPTSRQATLVKFAKIAEREEEKINPPEFLVPPYFFVDSYNDDWYVLSLKMAKIAKDLNSTKLGVYPILCISQSLLADDATIDNIIEDYKGFDGYLLWVSGFDELHAETYYLTRLAIFIKKLSALKKPIIALYGGYFFGILSKFGLTGFSSGICYGESKRVDRFATGGGAPIRFYLPFARMKVLIEEAIAFLTKNPEFFDDCQTCCQILNKTPEEKKTKEDVRQYFETLDAMRAVGSQEEKTHFLDARQLEIKFISKNSLSRIFRKILSDLKGLPEKELEDYEQLKIDHIIRWVDALQKAEKS